jgi:hypothetical protein
MGVRCCIYILDCAELILGESVDGAKKVWRAWQSDGIVCLALAIRLILRRVPVAQERLLVNVFPAQDGLAVTVKCRVFY